MIDIYLTNLILNNSILITGNGKQIALKALGHSGFEKKGNDIVCSAVSAIIQTSIIAITKVAGIHQKIDQRDGIIFTTISISRLNPMEIRDLHTILSTMYIGLKEIEKSYPESITIHFDKE